MIKASLFAPEQTELAKRAYDELVFDGRIHEASDFLRACIEKMLSAGKSEQALPLCKRLLNAHPEELANWDLALHLYDALGDSSGKAEALLSKCELLKQHNEPIDDLLEALKSIVSSLSEKSLLIRLSALFFEVENTVLALELLEQALLESAKTDSDEEQLNLLRTVREKIPANKAIQRRYLVLLKSTGSKAEWKKEAVQFIQSLKNDPELFDSVVDELEQEDPHDLSLKLIRFERLIAGENTPDYLQSFALEILQQGQGVEGIKLADQLMLSAKNTAAFSDDLLTAYVRLLGKSAVDPEKLSALNIQCMLQSASTPPQLLLNILRSNTAAPEEKSTALFRASDGVQQEEWKDFRQPVYDELKNLPKTEASLNHQLAIAKLLGLSLELPVILHELIALPSTQENPKRHQALLEEQVQLFPDDLSYLEELSVFHQSQGNSEEATNLLINQAELLEQKGELEKASNILQLCRENAPNNLLVQRKLVKVLLESGNKEEALSSLELIATQLQENGKTAEALTTWREVLSHNPLHTIARSNYLELAAIGEVLKLSDSQFLLGLIVTDFEKLNHKLRITLCKKILDSTLGQKELFPLITHELQSSESAFTTKEKIELYNTCKVFGDDDFSWKLIQELDPNLFASIADLEFIRKQAKMNADAEKALSALERWVQLLHQQGKHQEALGLIESELSENPESLRLRNLYSNALELTTAEPKTLVQFRLKNAELAVSQQAYESAKNELRVIEKQFGNDAYTLEQCSKIYLSFDEKSTAERLLSEAIETHLKQDQRELALELFDQWLEFADESRLILRRKAELLRDLDRFELAVEIYTNLLAEEKTLQQKIDLLRRILELNPKRNDLRNEYANLLAEFGQPQAAVEQLIKLYQVTRESEPELAGKYLIDSLELAPNNAKIRALRFAESIEHGVFQQAIIDANFLIGHYKKQGVVQEAVNVLDKLKEHFSEDHEEILRLETQLEGTNASNTSQKSPRVKLAKKLAKEGRTTEAITELEKTLNETPNLLEAQRALVPLYIKTNQFENAQKQYLTIINELLNQGSIDEATLVVDQLFHLDSLNIQLREKVAALFARNSIPEVSSDQYLWIARHYQEEKHLREAVRWAQRALECTPRSIDGRILLGSLLERLNQPNEASAQYLKAAELLVDNGSLEKAAQYVELICRLTPESAEPREQLVKLYEQIGQRNRVTEQLEKLAKLYSIQHRADDHVRVLKKMVQMNPDQTYNRTMLINALKQSENREELFQFLMLQGDLYLKKGKQQHAIKVFGEALSNSADRTGAVALVLEQIRLHGSEEQFVQYGLQQVEYDLAQDNIAEAQKLLNMLSTKAQKVTGYHLAMAALYEATSQEALAQEALAKAESLAEENATPEQKLELYTKLMKISPNNFSAWRTVIRTYRSLNRIEEAQKVQQSLANRLMEKIMHGEAVVELRALLQVDADNLKAWELLFEAQKQCGEEKDLLEETLVYSNILLEKKQFLKALEAISKVIRWDPYHLEARQAYIRTYLKVGKEEDLLEDYLTLADLLISKNRLDEAIHYFDKVTSIDPTYKNAQVRMTQTQRLKRGKIKAATQLVSPESKRPHEATQFRRSADHTTDTHSRKIIDTQTNSAHQFLMDEMDAMDKEDELSELRQIIQNYNDILSINPQNANVKVKLANLYLQINEKDNALKELTQARDLYSNKGEISTCIEVCEKILELNPTDQRTRLHLKQTINKRDAFKALESAIIFSDSTSDESKQP